MQRDFQKQRVYDWEREYVAPKDKSLVPFHQIQSLVDYVWTQEGFKYPPKVEPLPKHAITKAGTGCRLTLRFHRLSTPTWIILHEIAHGFASDHDDNSDRHGPLFVGLYMKLLARYMNISLFESMYTAREAGVKYDIAAQPFFLQQA